MPELKAFLEQVSVVLTINSKEFPLTAEVDWVVSTAGGGEGTQTFTPPAHIKWEYHKNYEDAIDLEYPATVTDKVAQALKDVQDWINGIIPPATPPSTPIFGSGPGESLMEQWTNMLENQLSKVPGIGHAARAIKAKLDKVNVRISDIVIQIDKNSVTNKYDSHFVLGVILDVSAVPDMPNVFGIQLKRCGATFGVDVKGMPSP